MKKNTNLRSILTDQSITDEEVSEWVDDLFKSFEDENGKIWIHGGGMITSGHINAQKTTIGHITI